MSTIVSVLGARGQRNSNVRFRFDPAAVAGIQGWMSTTHGAFLFGDGSATPGNGKDVQQVKDVLTGTTLFGQATLAARPIWDSTSFSVPCVRSNGAQYMERTPPLAAPGLVIAAVTFDAGITGNRAISGTRSTATPGGDALEDAWSFRRQSSGFLDSLVATSTGVFTSTTPQILGEPIIVMLEISGSTIMTWLAGAKGTTTFTGTPIAADGEQLLFAKYYNDLVAAILQGGIFEFAQYSPAPSAADRRRLVDFMQALLWPGVTPPLATTVNAGQIRQGESGLANVVAPSSGTSLILASVEEQPSVGTASVGSSANVSIAVPLGATLGNYSLKYCLRSDVAATRLVDFGDVLFEVIAAAVVDDTLPEDEPLPTPLGTTSGTTANFNSLLAAGGSATPGTRVTLAAGSYGARTIGVSGTAANPIQVVATTLLTPTITGLTITGQHVIVSGVTVDRGAAVETGQALSIDGSNVRVTRSTIANGSQCVNIGPGVADILIDHCDIKRSRDLMFWLAAPKDQRRITVARCWTHELQPGGNDPWSMGFAWNGENFYREVPHDIVVRLNYIGPGVASSEPDADDLIHHKGSKSIYAFNRIDAPNGHLLSHRFGLRARAIGNYAPGCTCRMWDDRGWYFGNLYANMESPAGKSAYYDDTTNLVNSVSGRHAQTRARISGNNSAIQLGVTFAQPYCTSETTHPDTLPDPRPAGDSKPERTYAGVTYAAHPPNDPDRGIKIRSHTGAITTEPAPPASCAISSWVANIDAAPSATAPASWVTDLRSEYPWVTDICPDPTSLTGGPGGSAPWSVAQGLVRGDLANPSVGPNRNSPGGLP
jgi:hypothetical protein